MQKVDYKDYLIRLSKIDMTADYIDEGIDVTEIYQDLMDGKIGIFKEYKRKNTGEIDYKRVLMKYEGYLKENEVPTIYIRSVQSNSRLRIYDKRREQLERKGTKLDKAVGCRKALWVWVIDELTLFRALSKPVVSPPISIVMLLILLATVPHLQSFH